MLVGSGEKVDRNEWMVADGPMAGEGLVRFTEPDDIPDLIGDLRAVSIELLSRTANNRRNAITEFVIIAEKPNT